MLSVVRGAFKRALDHATVCYTVSPAFNCVQMAWVAGLRRAKQLDSGAADVARDDHLQGGLRRSPQGCVDAPFRFPVAVFGSIRKYDAVRKNTVLVSSKNVRRRS